MAGNKKPKKKYVRGKVIAGGHLPAPVAKTKEVEMKALNALSSLRNGYYNSEIALDLIVFLTVCQSVISKEDTAPLQYLLAAFKAINSIKDREIRTGKWGVNGDELRVLNETIPMFIDLYKQMNRDEISSGNARAGEKLCRALARAAVAKAAQSA